MWPAQRSDFLFTEFYQTQPLATPEVSQNSQRRRREILLVDPEPGQQASGEEEEINLRRQQGEDEEESQRGGQKRRPLDENGQLQPSANLALLCRQFP